MKQFLLTRHIHKNKSLMKQIELNIQVFILFIGMFDLIYQNRSCLFSSVLTEIQACIPYWETYPNFILKVIYDLRTRHEIVFLFVHLSNIHMVKEPKPDYYLWMIFNVIIIFANIRYHLRLFTYTNLKASSKAKSIKSQT